MSSPVEILAGFLESFHSGADDRPSSEPPEEVRLKLSAFARGQLPPLEHSELLSLLNRNPGWVAWLAEEVKALRNKPDVKN